MARLVNKQFNSPIGLYSPQNIQEVLDREAKILANGAVGIDFRNPDVGKPANLKNSAVLRMLEEEENRQRNGFGPGAKRVAWPPPNESGPDSPYVEQNAVQTQGGPQYPSVLQQNNYHAPAAALAQNRTPLKPLDVRSPGGASPLASPKINPSPQGFRPTTPIKGWAPVHSPVQSPSQPSWKQPSTQYSSAHQPVSQQTYLGQQYQTAPTLQAEPQQYQSEQQQSYQTTQQYQYKNTQINQSIFQQPSPQLVQSTQQYFPSSQPQYQSPQHQAPQYTPKQEAAPTQVAQRPQPSRSVEPPPSTITLRPQAPVSQAPPPVFNSQPATATLKVKVSERNLRGDQKWPPEPVREKMLQEAENIHNSNSFLSLEGGKHLRGDLKWPPETVKVQAEEENRLRLELARGPVFRPKRPNKDYSQFFEKHALNSTYPGYKIPPGTQFYRPA